MRSEVDHRISYAVRGAPYRKLGRRHSRELGGTGISTRRVPRHCPLSRQVDSAIISCRDIGSHWLRRRNRTLKEQITPFGSLANCDRRRPRCKTGGCLDALTSYDPGGLEEMMTNEGCISLASASRSG